MFGKLKEKLKGWFKSSKEKIEGEAEVVETKEKVKKEKPEKEKKPEVKKGKLKPKETAGVLSKELEKKIKEKEKEIKKQEEKLKKEEEKLKKEEKKLEEQQEKIEKELKKKQEELEKKQKEEEQIQKQEEEIEEKVEEKQEKLKEIKKERKIDKELEKKIKEKEKEIKKQEELLKKEELELEKEEEKRRKEEEKLKKQEELKREELELEKKQKELEEQIKKEQEKIEQIQKEKEEIEKQEQEVEEEAEEEKEEKSFFQKLKSKFSYKITEDNFSEIFDELEMVLLESNVALEVTEDLKKKLSEKLIGKEIPKEKLEEKIREELKNSLNELLIEPDNPLEIIKISEKPFVILFFGINGTGKTTSIAKIAYFLKKSGFSVALAASDTFRAASIEQISEHGKKLNTPIIKHDYGSDPAAVGFDAIKYAKKHKIDVVLIDTAGRMHTKTNLMAEMEKISRVTNPDLKIFVAESIAGNDATEQAKTFHEAIEIDGSILSKTDIDEKGGTIISVSHATGKPIFYLGTGQKYEDLELFNKQKFIENLGL